MKDVPVRFHQGGGALYLLGAVLADAGCWPGWPLFGRKREDRKEGR